MIDGGGGGIGDDRWPFRHGYACQAEIKGLFMGHDVSISAAENKKNAMGCPMDNVTSNSIFSGFITKKYERGVNSGSTQNHPTHHTTHSNPSTSAVVEIFGCDSLFLLACHLCFLIAP